MAGGKETPRQKMIGMMYLVLTALLALNVSKEILNAFVVIDQKTQNNVAATEKNVGFIYSEFESAMADEERREKAQEWYIAAKKVQQLTKRAVSDIIDIKLELIEATEGENWVENVDDNGKRVLKPLSELSSKDNYDVPTNIMVGSDPSSPQGRAVELREMLEMYRDSLCFYLGNVNYGDKKMSWSPQQPLDYTSLHPDDTSIVRQLYESLMIPEQVQQHEEVVSWETGMFDHSPLVATLALLSGYEADLKSAEAEAVQHLFSKVGGTEFNFNTIAPIAAARTSYLNMGDSAELKVYLAAYDSLETPMVSYQIDSSGEEFTANAKDGFGSITLRGDQPGLHWLSGRIGVKTKTGVKYREWKYPYMVGTPTAAVGNYDTKVMYAGYDNKIVASASGFDQVDVRCDGCTSFRKSTFDGQDGYIAQVRGGTRFATVTVNGIDKDGNSVRLSQDRFRVLRVPTPIPILSGQKPGETINKNALRNAKVTASLDGSPLTINYTVESFSIKVVASNGRATNFNINGNEVPSRVYEMVRGLEQGARVELINVRARSVAGPRLLNQASYPIQ